MRIHAYETSLLWTGSRGDGTSDYRAYDRAHEISADGKPTIAGSADPAFRGDAARWNPEELLVAALSQCHMLWYLHLASVAGVVVTAYSDTAVGTMAQDPEGGGGQFTRVVLRPRVTVAEEGMRAKAESLHREVGPKCFIARSVAFPVEHEPEVLVTAASPAAG